MARKRTTLVSEALNYIRGKILSYELRPGQPISDNKIALEMSEKLDLKISRSPVREAFMMLQAEGLVEMIDDKICVARITDRDVFEICQVRDAIEQQSVIIAMENGGFTEEQKNHLSELYRRLITAKGQSSEADEYLIDDEFHLYLADCTGNRRLMEIAGRMCTQMQRVRWLNMISPNRRQEANSEHEEILNAIIAGDKDRALKAIHTHNINTQINFHKIFESEELRKALVCLLD